MNSDCPEPRRPKAVQVSLEGPDALGTSVRRLANSSAIAVTFTRDALKRVSAWPELSRRGVYILIAPAAGDHAFRVYVGQAQNVLQRLKKHERNREFPRYLQVAVVVSTDDQMRGDVAFYLEQRMIQALVMVDMVMVENRSLRFPTLHEADQIVAEQFFRDALLLLGPVEPMAAMVASTIASLERRNELLDLSSAGTGARLSRSIPRGAVCVCSLAPRSSTKSIVRCRFDTDSFATVSAPRNPWCGALRMAG